MFLSRLRSFLLLGLLLVLVACGGGGGGSSGNDEDTGSTDGGTTPTDNTGGSGNNGGNTGGNGTPDNSAGVGDNTQTPVLQSLITDLGPVGEGRIIDATIQFSGVSAVGDVVQLYLNGDLAGSSMARSDGTWRLDYSMIPLVPGNYSVELTAISPSGATANSARPFLFVYDPNAPAAPVIAGVTDDSGVLGDGITSDTNLVINGTAQAGMRVELFMNSVLLGATTSDSDGNWSYDHSAVTLADGAYTLAAETVFLTLRSATSVQFNLVVDTQIPAVPVFTGVTPDSGISATDGLTNSNNLTFTGTAEAGSQVRVVMNNTVIGSTTADGTGNWNFNYGAITLPEGSHQAGAFVVDAAGNTSATSPLYGFTIDNTPPAAGVVESVAPDSGIAGDGITTNSQLIFSGTAEPDLPVAVYLDGVLLGTVQADGAGDWTYDHSAVALADGTYQITAIVSDAAGNAAAESAPLTVVVDSALPAAPVVTTFAADTGVTGDGITADTGLVFSGTAEAGVVVQVLVNAVPVGTTTANGAGNWSYDHSAVALIPGSYAVTAIALDNAGNASAASAALTVTVDTVAPATPSVTAITTDSGAAGDGITNDNTLVFSGTADANASVNVLVNSVLVGTATANGAGNWSFDYSGTLLADGSYPITATVTDVAGNTSATSGAFDVTVDTAIPAAPSISAISTDTGIAGDGITGDNTLVISGTAEANASVNLLINAVVVGAVTADSSGNWNFDYTGTTLVDNSYAITATADDVAGNVSAPSATFSVTIDSGVPAAPVVTAITTDSGTAGDGITSDNTLVISGTAEANISVNVLLDAVSIGTVTADGAGVWSFDYTGTVLADNSYVITAIAADSAGNSSATSAAFPLVVDTGTPATPVVTGITSDNGTAGDGNTNDNTLVISGTAEAGVSVNVQLNAVSIGTATANGAGVWSFDYTGTVLADSSYVITAIVSDAAGNSSATSAAFNVVIDTSTPAVPAVTAITTDSGTAGDGITNDNTLLISGTADANISVNVLLNAVSIGTTTANGAGVWSLDHTSNALADNTYAITAIASDTSGNSSAASAAFNFTVDTGVQAAPTVTGISTDSGTAGDGITNDNTLVIAGTAEGGASVNVLIDAVSIGTATANGAGMWSFDYTGTALVDNTYAITAVASDVAGNVSSPSAAFNIRIDSGTPATPSVTAFSADTGASGDGITGDNTLTFSGTAEANATVNVLLNAVSIGTVTASGAGNWTFDYTGTVLANNSYSVTATATDASGNVSLTSAALAVTVDAQAPAIATLNPVDGATAVGVTQNLVLTLDESVQIASGNLVIRHFIDDTVFETIPIGDARITGGGTNTLTINPTGSFVGGTQYYVEIAAGAFSDAAGNGFAGISGNGTWSFTSVSTTLVSTVPADEATGVALNTTLTFTFSEAVTANIGNVLVRRISDSSIVDTIDMATASVGGDGTATLVLNQSGVLDPNTAYYVEIEAGAFINANNVAFAGIAGNSTLNFATVNVAVPTVTNVTSSLADGTYRGGDTIPLQIQFSESVNVTGTPQLYVNLDGADKYINYSSGSGSTTLQFDFLVATGDSTADLDYVSSAALVLNGGAIRSASSANANLLLPNPGAAGSLGNNKNIVIAAASLDITNLTPADGFIIEGSEASTVYFGHSVSSGGDFNGDGFEDLAIGVPDSNLVNTSGGYAYLVFGQAGATRSDLAMSAFTGADGIAVTGAAGADRLGSVVDISGDLNGDGFDDLVIVSSQADAAVSNSGTAYVVWGSATPANINIAGFNTTDGFTNANGFVIAGYESAGYLGYFLSTDPRNAQYLDARGDFNGDGIDDLLIGHDRSDLNGASSGMAYLVFGQTGATRANLRLDTFTSGFSFYTSAGADNEVGHSVQYIGDFNGDGNNDVLIGASQADGGANDSGEAYVVFGNAGPVFGDIDLASLNGSNGFTLTTANGNAQLGGSVASADINGDGLTDLIIGAPETETLSRVNNGVAIVLYGNTGSPYSDIALESIPAGAGFVIHGENNTDRTSHSVRGAGDVNGDGIEDLLLSTIHDDEGGASAGAAWIIFGRTGTARASIDLSILTSSDGFKIIGDAAGDEFGGSATAGDINGDGYQDLMISSVAGDNAGSFAGEVNVIWGNDFSGIVFGSLTGNASANNIVGTSGNDTIVGGGGADAVSAGAGDDLIQVADLNFVRIDGGRGDDTLEITGSARALDLRTLNYEKIQGIEFINLGNRGNSLTLDKLALLALSDEVRTLYVRGGSSDWVVTDAGETWVANGTAVVNTITYNRYDLNEVSLFVQQSLSQPAVPGAPAITAFATDSGTTGDGITSDNRLVFSGTTGAFFNVQLFINAVSIGSTTANGAGAWSFDHSGTALADATHSVTARASNLGGYTSAVSSALTVTVDASVPAAPAVTAITTDTGTAGDGNTSDTTLIISGTAEANAGINVLRNGVSIGTTTASGAGSWSFDSTGTALADNTYSFTATASDSAGNTSVASSSFSVSIDTGAPATPVVTGISSDSGTAGDGVTSDTTLSINGTAEANAVVTVLRDAVSIGTTSANGAGSWTFDYSGTALAAGTYQFTAVATDGAGNSSSASTSFGVTVDTTAPTVSTLNPADNATGVLPTANLVLTFDSVVTAQTGNITLRRTSDNGIFEQIPVGDPRVTGSGTTTITINPTATFAGGVGYYVQIDSTAFDDVAGNGFAGISDITSWNFATQTLDLTGSTPADNATNVALNSAIVLNFNVAALASSGNIVIRHSSDDSIFETIAVGSGQVSGTGTSTVTVTPSDVFLPNTGYYVEIAAGAFVSGSGASFAGISGNSTLNFTTANPPVPTVTGVTSSTADGTYTSGNTVVVQVVFSEIVNVTLATPRLTLDLEGIDRTVSYVSGTGSNTLVFNYSVSFGDASADLDYLATNSLSANSARIRSANYVNATLTLPTPGAAGSLGANKNIVISAASISVASMGSSDGFQVQGSTASEHVGWSVNGVGDVNGDGFEDFVTGAPYNATNSGVAYIVYGQAGATRSNINTSAINNGTNGFRITGQSASDYLGASVGGAGDINDDGYDDIYVIAPRDDDYNTDAGILFVIYGKASNTNVAISSFSSSIGFRVTTAEISAAMGDAFTGYATNGQAIDAGGDFNGDGVQDLVVGLRFSDKNGADSGKAYVIFGRAGATRTDVNLDLIDPTGTDGVMINGASAGAQLGQAVQFVGDYDADGYDDIVASAIFSDAVANDGGQAFLIFGSPGPLFSAVDVSTLSGASGFKISTSELSGVLGHGIGAGDFNGDGISDLLISENGYNATVGAAHVIYGDAGGVYSNIAVDTMLSSTGYGIFGQSVGEYLGHSLSSAGDFNADGIDDLLVASYLRDDGGADSGAAWLITGALGTARADLNIGSITAADGFKMAGGGVGDHFGQSTAFVDANGDGFSDLILGATWGDNASIDGGETLVLWGREFATAITSGLTGTGGADNLVGTSGDDTIVSGGGADAISAGAGNDTIQLSDTGFFNIEGGEGTDILQITTGPNTLDLTAYGPETINGIEVIDLGSTGTSLIVSKESVQDMSRESRALFVRGSLGTVTSTTGDAWCYTGTKVVGGITYHVYLDNGAILYVQSGLTHSGVGNFNSTQQYTFNTTFGGANVSSAVTDFPVLIRVSNTIRNTLQASRADLRFTDKDQVTWLPYEIEIGASGELYAWVLVPQVDGNSSSDYIVMHYNDKVDGTVADRQDPTRLWVDYAGVWHFDEASGNALDSTAYQNNGTQTGTVSRVSYGIGRGAEFNSSTERFTVPYDISMNVSGRAWSVLAWQNYSSCNSWASSGVNLVNRGTSGNFWQLESAYTVSFITLYQAPKAYIGSDTLGGGGVITWAGGACESHLALTYDPSVTTKSRMYTNATDTGTSNTAQTVEALQAMVMGNTGTSNNTQLDEVRLGRKAFSASYIKLSYENQGSTSLVSP